MHTPSMMDRYSYLAITTLVICVFNASSCEAGGNLSRDRAKELIQKEIEKDPSTRSLKCGEQWYQTIPKDDDGYGKIEEQYKRLVESGLLKINAIKSIKAALIWHFVYTFSYTAEALPHLVGECSGGHFSSIKVTVARKIVSDVSGVTVPAEIGGQKMCKASFNYTLSPTVFGEVLLDKRQASDEYAAEAMFVLYDDGWRVERIRN